MSGVPNKFYTDVHAVLNRWEFLILRIQGLLIWERVLASLFFNIAVHLVFWAIVLANQSCLFVVCILLSVYVICDLMRNWLVYLIDDPNCSPDSFAEFIASSLQQGHILSVEELSLWVARLLYYIMSIINSLAPCRRKRPLLFFLITSTSSLMIIWISNYLPGLIISYGLLNLCLIAPVLIHHRVGTRLWTTIKPILEYIEAEFDRNPLESASERAAAEAEFYEPIIAAAAAANPHLFSDANTEGFLSDSFLNPPQRQREGSEDLDTSEAVFIKQFVPKMSDEDIDKLFAGILDGQQVEGPDPPESPPIGSLGKQSRFASAIMSDEYDTDDDQVEELNSEIEDDRGGNNHSNVEERYLGDFVFVPKKTN